MAGSSFSGDRSNTDTEAAAACRSRLLEALVFARRVTLAFEERHPYKYHLFHRLMEDIRNHRIGMDEVTSTATALFRDTPELAVGFNAFLPEGYEIQVVVLSPEHEPVRR